MNNLKNINKFNKFNKSVIVLSLGLALSACGGSDDNDGGDVVNAAPTISSTAVTTVESGTAYSYSLVAADADGDTLTKSAANLPAWLTFDSATGSLSGTPAESDAGDTAITLTVSDGTNDIMQSFTISVTVPTIVNNAAVITSTGVTSAKVGDAYSYTLTATDADSDSVNMSTTIPGTLSWLTFDANTNILSGTPGSGDAGATAITLTVNDGTEDTMQTFTITVAEAEAVVVDTILYDDNLAAGLAFNSYNPDSAVSYSEVDETGRGNIINVIKTGANGNLYFEAAAPYDLSNGGELVFDVNVTSTDANVDLLVKFDSGWPNVSDYSVTIPTLGEWAEVRVDIAGMLASGNSLSPGSTVTPSSVNNIFVIEPQGVMTVKFDNIILSMNDDNTGGSDDSRTPGDSGDGATTTTAMGIAFEGTQLTWSSFDTAKVQYIANPVTNGINTSATAALFDIHQGDGEWVGALTQGINSFALGTSNCIVNIDVYKDTISEVHLKFQKNNGVNDDGIMWGSHGTKSASNTLINQWETLAIDFCDSIGLPENDVIGALAIFPDKTGSRSQDTMNYIDNIMFTAQGDVVVTGPTDAAPTPTEAAADVISVFSESYTAVAGVILNPNWNQTTVTTEVEVAGNNTLKMAGLDYQGIEFATQDVSGKTSLHLDYWTADATTFDVFLISSGDEASYTVTTTQNGWQSVDIPLSTYTTNGDLTQAYQFKFVGSGTIHLDNLYFNEAQIPLE